MEVDDVLTLLDWKRRVFELYAAARTEPHHVRAWHRWRAGRDELFRDHPQSPLSSNSGRSFDGLPYFDHNPLYRVYAELTQLAGRSFEIATSGEAPMRFDRIGLLTFDLTGERCKLEAYWLTAYGGGLFVPFADATSGTTTYGAGRYLLDTVKGADLGERGGRVVLDFNFAYNPSCAYDPRWVCPLAPPANRLDIAVEAGEKLPSAGTDGSSH